MKYDDHLDMAQLRRYAQSMNGRARKLRVSGTLSAALLRDRIYESGGRCEWCHTNLLQQEFELDHIVNLARGGSNIASNIVVSCPDCNRRKSSRHVASFALETLARTGIETTLIQRVLTHFNVQGRVQRHFFEDAEASFEPFVLTNDEPEGDTPTDEPHPGEVPPYRW
ncbi:HNH endonuclease [Phototrophicus methaneseepsis]|uniref:HNH endonuclease n=1 Tax=Phototrophicus methaneseepsis TaxID=2710758 RepID=A0A7S8IGT7_9CHLR|nr:HNH endonuclease signature motif containing protein [Phototrophicus methaneseepsis]QPC84448.1 HNH endonuclease [Phototrophicus methaneseepsis]